MKKLNLLFIAALAMISCGNTYNAKQVSLSDMNDSVNYALGLVNGSQIKMMYLQNDSSDAVIAEFIDALQAGYDSKEKELSEVATVGKSIGEAIKAGEKKGLADNPAWALDEELFFQGMVNGLFADTVVMKVDDARSFFQEAYRASQENETKAEKTLAKKAKCPSKVKAVKLNNLQDSVNYAFGLLNGNEVKMYVLSRDSDESMVKEFIKYVNIGLKSDVLNPQLVNMGEQIGKNIKDQEALGLLGESKLVTDFELIKQGFINGMYGFTKDMTGEQAGQYIQNTLSSLKYGNVKEQGEQFLAENKLKECVIETESGLQYEVITMGKGPKPSATDRVKVHYHGTLIDGTVFDSSVNRGEPIVFGLNQVIAGWTEGVQLMPVGSKFRFYIPQNLAYGDREAGSIPPYSTLIFEVELLGIEK